MKKRLKNEVLMHMDLERILEKQANVWPEYYWQILRLFYEEEKSLVEISENFVFHRVQLETRIIESTRRCIEVI